MALPTVSGKGFIISDLDFKYLGERAVVNFAVAFKKQKKNDSTGNWDTIGEVVLRVAAWGELAEYVQANFSKLTDIDLTGELSVRTYDKKDGTEGTSVELTARTVGAPIVRKSAGSDDTYG